MSDFKYELPRNKVTVTFNLTDTELEAINHRFGIDGKASQDYAATWLWSWASRELDKHTDNYMEEKYRKLKEQYR